MQVTLPSRTASEITLPGGLVVWIQTVNALQREAAREAADLYASREARTYRKGGEGWTDLAEQFEDGGIDVQTGFIADAGFLDGTYQRDAEAKHPQIDAPVRNDNETDEAFDKRVLAWESAVGPSQKKRTAHIEAAYNNMKKGATGLLESTRIERCCRIVYERKRREAFSTRFVLEMLARAVRTAEDHAIAVYHSADVVADLPDEIREALMNAYFNNDNVTPAAVPTSAGSC